MRATKAYLDANQFAVNATVHSLQKAGTPVEVTVHERDTGNEVASHTAPSDKPFQFTVSSPQLWSPDSPHLYNVTVSMGADHIRSYTGFRTVSKGKVDGVVRPLVNGEFTFHFGTLDQGYWPDGIYVPPNREAMVYDLNVLKKLGFNMVRKHVSCSAWNPGAATNQNRSKSSRHCSIKRATKSASL